MTPKELIKEDQEMLEPIKIPLLIIQSTNLIFQTIDTLSGTYRNKHFYYTIWISWFVINVLCFIAWKFEKPILYRVAHHIMTIRNLLPMYNIGDAQKMDDLGKLIQFCQLQFIGLFCGSFVAPCMFERAKIHVPVSILYQLIFNFGLISLYFAQSGQYNAILYVFENKLAIVLIVTFFHVAVQYDAVITLLYYKTQLYNVISKSEISQMTLQVLLNHLN